MQDLKALRFGYVIYVLVLGPVGYAALVGSSPGFMRDE
jgi:hypothetical protein